MYFKIKTNFVNDLILKKITNIDKNKFLENWEPICYQLLIDYGPNTIYPQIVDYYSHLFQGENKNKYYGVILNWKHRGIIPK